MNIVPFVHAVSWGNLSNLASALRESEIATLPQADYLRLGSEFSGRFPELAEIGAHVLHQLNGPAGFCVIDDLNRLDLPPEAIAAAFVMLCHQIGTPSSHNEEHKVVWDVRDRGAAERERTFSERTGEAPFHTDSAFAIRPEEYFGLYTLQAADCGGGLSRIIPATRLLAAMNASAEGRHFRQVLERNFYPFKIPPAFSSSGRVIFGKIIDNGKLRYRHDCIRQGMAESPARVTSEMADALAWFDALVEGGVQPIEMGLAAGQAVFVNNRRVLHARSDYQDAKRHLLRVRMHAFDGAAPN